MLAGTDFPIVPFGETALSAIGGSCFVGLLAVASVSDVRRRRIPNVLVICLAVLGIGYSLVTVPASVGAARALVGLGLGFVLWIPFYALGMLGAGDVKLFAAACCWLAPSQAFAAAIVSALAGGVLSVIGLVLAHGVGLTTFRLAHVVRDPKLLATPLSVPSGRPTLPYGLAMALGLALVGWFPGLLRLM
jgi:prepilin peptidase CpaA